MEQLKPLSDLSKPDRRSPAVGIDLHAEHRMMDALTLRSEVPEDVRSYMHVIKTLWVYGYFYYPFFSVTLLLAAGAAEMAIRLRFPWQPQTDLERRKGDRRRFAHLLKEAKNLGLIREADFPHIRASQVRAAELRTAFGAITGGSIEPSPTEYVDRLVARLPQVRNTLAHPQSHVMVPPAMLRDNLVAVVELINAIWDPSRDHLGPTNPPSNRQSVQRPRDSQRRSELE